VLIAAGAVRPAAQWLVGRRNALRLRSGGGSPRALGRAPGRATRVIVGGRPIGRRIGAPPSSARAREARVTARARPSRFAAGRRNGSLVDECLPSPVARWSTQCPPPPVRRGLATCAWSRTGPRHARDRWWLTDRSPHRCAAVERSPSRSACHGPCAPFALRGSSPRRPGGSGASPGGRSGAPFWGDCSGEHKRVVQRRRRTRCSSRIGLSRWRFRCS